MCRMHVIYSGRVQGVGFRYTTQSIARQAGVSGWVKNRADGTVEVVAEGPEELLKRFLEEVRSAFSAYIRDTEVDWSDPTGEFTGFGINF